MSGYDGDFDACNDPFFTEGLVKALVLNQGGEMTLRLSDLDRGNMGYSLDVTFSLDGKEVTLRMIENER